MKYPCWSGTQIEMRELPPELVLRLETLPYGPERYFELGMPHQVLKVGQLAASRARPDGIVNACALMRSAAAGKTSRRKPLEVRLIENDRFLVSDGNSTFLNALFSGWPNLPCVVVTEGSATPEGGLPHG